MKRERSMILNGTNSSRRNFIRQVAAAAAGLLVVPYLRPSGVLAYTHGPGATSGAIVGICNTSNTPADSYIYDDAAGGVKQKVKYLLDLLDQQQAGAVSALFGEGKKVAIKINLTGGSGTSAGFPRNGYLITDAMWTHPAVIQAVGQFILDAGVRPADLYIVDAFWDTTWRDAGSIAPFGSNDKFGYLAVQQALGCNVVDLNDPTPANLESVSTGTGYYNFPSITMNKVLQGVDVYVSIPKLKHHSMAGLTSALKNQVGIVPVSLYTITNDNGRRGALHHPTSTAAEWNYLPESVCDLNAARPVHLAVIDGIKNSTGGEGTWCPKFNPCSSHALIAGIEPVATDSIAAKLMGLDPEASSFPLPASVTSGGVTTTTTDNHLSLLHAKGVGTNQLNEIQLVGDGASLVTSVEQAAAPTRPAEFQLCSNFPNPFNPSTIIVFALPRDARVTLKVYDVAGHEIDTLVEGDVPAGEHRLQWSAHGLASGFYICRLTAGDFSQSIKMIYQK
jgi:uncharacterized protein (DUF362 family)